MKAKDLIEENNKKRKQLSKKNLAYYEDMLVYIRLSFHKSEQETEEVLSELLDHLLQAQQDGKTAEDIFGEDPKQYAEDIIGELPQLLTKNRMQLFLMGVLYFLAAVVVCRGLFDILMFVFNKGELVETYHIMSVFLRGIISIPIAFLLMYAVIHYLRWSCFKNIHKVLEFFLSWLFGIISLGIFMVVILLIPDFGPILPISAYVVVCIGVSLYGAGRITKAIT